MFQNLSNNLRSQAQKEKESLKLADNEASSLEREKKRLAETMEQTNQNNQRQQVTRLFKSTIKWSKTPQKILFTETSGRSKERPGEDAADARGRGQDCPGYGRDGRVATGGSVHAGHILQARWSQDQSEVYFFLKII